MNKVRLGILGMGNMGSCHLENILCGRCPEITVTAVCDLRPERLEAARARVTAKQAEDPSADIPDVVCFGDADDMYASGLIDAVLVSIPHYGHPEHVIKAMRAGLHVMCEKPVGVYMLQAREMAEEADRHPELTFGVMFNQRTNPVYRRIKEILDAGELGEIRRVSWIITGWYRSQAYYDSADWRATWAGEGGGVLLNQCVHNVDLLQWLCGMPTTVYARVHCGKWHDIEVEDDVSAYMEYENGATATLVTSTGDMPGTNRLEIVCDGGTLVTNGSTVELVRLGVPESVFTRSNRKPFATPPVTRVTVQADGENSQHVGVLNAFAAAILRGEPLVADGREGLNSLMLTNAMHLSEWTRKPVELPFDEALHRDLLLERVKTSRRKELVGVVCSIEEVMESTKGGVG